MAEQVTRFELGNRYVFQGKLVMQTALHIGGGKASPRESVNPVVLTPDGLPFIPGSSFKGSLRSTVEKLIPGLPPEAHFSTCGLIDAEEAALHGLPVSGKLCSTQRQSEITKLQRDKPKSKAAILKQVLADRCNTCQLFGSPYAAARVTVSDLYMEKTPWGVIIQHRDGVAIDRDSEKAKDRLKYDFEVVPASTAFTMKITLENATRADLQLLCIGLSEFVHGFATIGGKRSRGLGATLLEDLHVDELKLQPLDDSDEPISAEKRNKHLKNYLLGQGFSQTYEKGEEFLALYVNDVFEKIRNV